MDRAIYRDYIVNRRFFIYCSLATGSQAQSKRHYRSPSVHAVKAIPLENFRDFSFVNFENVTLISFCLR